MSKDLELALRIRADLQQGQAELQQFTETLTQTSTAADAAAGSLGQVGETANQQADRIRTMVEASLAQAAAQEQAREGLTELTQTQVRATENYRNAAAAQTASMNAHWQAERALMAQDAAQTKAAGSTAKAAQAADQQAKELGELLGKIDPVTRELERLDALERQLAQARSAGRIDLETHTRYNAILAESRNRIGGVSDAQGRAALTARQYQQAMRQLPMQLTDITTSLVSGMPIWMVAVQQGGQIKDSFGGIGPAARAVVSAINPMTLAIAAAVAAVAATVIAFEQGAAESRRYREALIMTGNAAGTSSDQMAAMAARIDGVIGTQRQAAAALTAAARTGKIARTELEMVGQTAVAMQVATGRAVEETVAEFVSLAKDPVSAVMKLNDQYNFLTAAVFEQIMALREQGDEYAAAKLAMETYGSTMQSRSEAIIEDLGLLQRAWRGVKGAAAEAWDAMLDIGREGTLEEQLERVEARLRQRERERQSAGPLGALGSTREDDTLLDDRERLRLAIQQRDADAERAGEQRQLNNESIEAQQYLNQLREQNLDRVEKKEKAIAEYRANVERIRAADPGSALISEDQIAKDVAAIEKRYAEPKGRTGKSEAERLTEQNQRWVAQLEKEAATFNQGKAALREYELDQRNLTGALRDRALAAWEALDAAEKQKAADEQAKRDTQLLAQLQLDYLKATGQSVAAAEAEIEKKYGELRERLLARGETDQASLVDQLIGVEKAQAQLADLERQIDRVFAEQSRREQSIQTQIQAGLITESAARREIVDLHQETAAEVEKLLPLMEELAELTGDPDAIERLRDLQVQLESLQVSVSELALALRDGLEHGIADALMGLVRGTHDLRDALDSLVLGIAESMAQFASQQLAEMATQGIMDLFSQGVQAATAAAGQKAAAEVVAINTVTAAQTAADATRAASSVAAANTAAAGQATAAATTASSWTPAAIAASIGSFGSAAAIGLAAVVAAMAFQAFADGGHVRGPGTTTSDSIPAWLSDYEFVTRAAVVQQPGALPFLQDFNARGMTALDDWAGRVRHATGGLAGVPAPALPAPSMGVGQLAESAAPSTPNVNNNFRFNAVFDIEDVARRLGTSSAFKDILINVTASNASAMNEALS